MQLAVTEFNKGIRLLDAGRPEKALQMFKKVLRVSEFKEAWLNLGVAYKGLNQLKKVKECFDKAADPNMPLSDKRFIEHYEIAINNIGLWHYSMEQDDEAVKCYAKAAQAFPDSQETIWNMAIARLRKYCSHKDTNLQQIWGLYNSRFTRLKADKFQNDKMGLFHWDGTTVPVPGSKLVVLNEQGSGDMIMFGRYLEYAEKFFDEVYVMCLPELNYMFSKYKTVTAASQTDANYGIPMCSLGRMLDYIPDGEWLASKRVTGGDGILCVWGGSASHVNNRNRSVSPGFFDRFSKYGKLYSLGESRKGYEVISIKNWEHTIKELGKVRLVISVDTSIVHLCGSLGIPCICLMPLLDSDFRWGDSSMGTDNVWYKSVKIIRNPNDWETTFRSAERELNELISKTS